MCYCLLCELIFFIIQVNGVKAGLIHIMIYLVLLLVDAIFFSGPIHHILSYYIIFRNRCNIMHAQKHFAYVSLIMCLSLGFIGLNQQSQSNVT